MTKSIEEQAEEYYKKSGWVPTENAVMNFKAGAKSRDVEWLKVVNELRSIILSQPRYTDNNQMEVVERDSFKTAMNRLTKADQMLKEMGMK